MQKSLKVLLHQYIIPNGLLSRMTYLIMHARHVPFRNSLVNFMIRRHSVNVGEALDPDHTNRTLYPNINSFFVRALKPDVRPIVTGKDKICSPADGTISQIGAISNGRIIQAKGHSYSVTELLGGSEQRAQIFSQGQFATVYLSPRDYHRVHIPYSGTLKEMVHIPGKLLSVAPFLIDSVENLFARNERVVSIFETEIGPMAVVLVGAINVGSIETVWAGEITPPRGHKVTTTTYSNSDSIALEKGDELGRFNMGSTVIVLFAAEHLQWSADLGCNDKVKMGQLMASVKAAIQD